MKKRILSMFLALAMCLTLCVPAFATEEEITITIGGVEYQQTIDEAAALHHLHLGECRKSV
ncbi:MAG: hypothetical protein ACLU38_12915 [Dysosmobacter sp.]